MVHKTMNNRKLKNFPISFLKFMFCGALLSAPILSACSPPETSSGIRVAIASSVENDLPEAISERAKALRITAHSVTFIESRTPPQSYYYGRANPNSLFQAASLSKPVAAAGILIVAGRYDVDLDADISGQFKSIDITRIKGGGRPFSLRQLLSHTAGTSQSGYPGYPKGKPIPDPSGVILKPTASFVKPMKFLQDHGNFRYSGGGYMLAQIWAEDKHGTSFENLMSELVFQPLGMTRSTFAQPIDPAAIKPLTIASADMKFKPRNGVFRPQKDSWRNYPEQAAAGLWTTTEDYAIFVSHILSAANGKISPVPKAVARAMLTPEAKFTEKLDYGLGVMLEINADSTVRYISHSGLNAGYRALFSARPETSTQKSRIVVSFSNAPNGELLNEEVVSALLEREQ